MSALLGQRRLKVAPLAKDTDFVADRGDLTVVLGWLVYHAMDEGMTKLMLGVNKETNESWMRFFGPFWHENPVWYDMVPPEAYCYPLMLQVCISLAELDVELPLKGTISAVKGRKHLDLELEVSEIHSFQLAWDKEYADRNRPYWEESEQRGPDAGHAEATGDKQDPDESHKDSANGEDAGNGERRGRR